MDLIMYKTVLFDLELPRGISVNEVCVYFVNSTTAHLRSLHAHHSTKPPPLNQKAHQDQQDAPKHQVGGAVLANTRSRSNQLHRFRRRAGGLQFHGVAHQPNPKCLAAAMKSPPFAQAAFGSSNLTSANRASDRYWTKVRASWWRSN